MLDEIVLRHATTEEACARFHEAFGEHRTGIVVYGDASGNNAADDGELRLRRSCGHFFRANGRVHVEFRVPKANPLRAGTNQPDERETAGRRRGRLLCWCIRRCKELIKDFEQVAYKEDTNLIDKDKDRQRTHLSDALGYLVWQECRPAQHDRMHAANRLL